MVGVDPSLERRVRELLATPVGRGAEQLSVPGGPGLVDAASHLAGAPGPVVVITGFLIPTADPPAAETDGPPGAVALARVLRSGGRDVRLLTDDRCEPVVTATAAGPGPDLPVDVVRVDRPGGDLERLTTYYRSLDVTTVVAVERPGPAADGVCRSMSGVDVVAAPLEEVFTAGPWVTVGVGDGGNELGMGSLAPEVVARHIEGGDRIHCRVPCDHLVIAGTSNWGAYGLVVLAAALDASLAPAAGEELTDRVTTATVEGALRGGAVDGVTKRPDATVDGLAPSAYGAVLTELRDLLGHETTTDGGAAR